jgi:hypothetical protein
LGRVHVGDAVTVFTSEDRLRLRTELLEYAALDRRISGAALTGSAATDQEDRWSDIDLAFGVADAAALPAVMSDWTAHLYDRYSVLHHMDITFGGWIYRVFLLPNTLQVDLAFVAAAEFRALSPSFRLVAGEAKEPWNPPPQSAAELIGYGWLYALHVRSCIARGKFWQAEYMISGVRDQVLALACIRHDLPAIHGRGMDRLPSELTASLEEALVRKLEASELWRAFQVAVAGLLREIHSVDEPLAERLRDALMSLSQDTQQRRARI